MTPLMPMYTLGHDFVPPPVHAGGLRYHGDAPSLCALVKEGLVEATAIAQTAAFEAAVRFARCEGIIPGPEPAHAIRAVFDEAEAAKQAGEERVILFNLSGHGHFDMSAYAAYFAGELEDLEMPEDELEAALETPARGAGARVAAEARADRLRDRRRRAAARLDEDVAELALHRGLAAGLDHELGGDRGLAQAGDAGYHLELVVESQGRQVADGGLGHDHVDPGVDHRLVAAELPPELGHRQVEVGQVVGVEDDALRVALVVADPQAMPEGLAHIP